MRDDPTQPLRTALRAERRRRGWSQQTLGQRLGRAGYSTVHQWETGKNDLQLSNFMAWAQALGYRVELIPTEDLDG